MKKIIILLAIATQITACTAYSQWGSLASNQLVSEINLLTSGFTLIGTNPGTTKIVTKAEALAMYSLDGASMSAYASNQCPPKSAFVALTGRSAYFTNTDPCINWGYGSAVTLWYDSGDGLYYTDEVGGLTVTGTYYDVIDDTDPLDVYYSYNVLVDGATTSSGTSNSPCF